MGIRFERTLNAVTKALKAGTVLKAYNALDREDTTTGPYREAVDSGMRFAVVGWQQRHVQFECRTAKEAAEIFINRVGTSRALAAVREIERLRAHRH